jgi:GMP synthase (glutamine-hydrolysing)
MEGKWRQTGTREYGRANLGKVRPGDPLFKGFEPNSQVWMSHGDTITAIPEDCHVIASTEDVHFAAYASR